MLRWRELRVRLESLQGQPSSLVEAGTLGPFSGLAETWGSSQDVAGISGFLSSCNRGVSPPLELWWELGFLLNLQHGSWASSPELSWELGLHLYFQLGTQSSSRVAVGAQCFS